MGHRYGIYQSSSKSCVFYKQDQDGNQSTFNIFISPKKDEINAQEVVAFIDNEQLRQENLSIKTENIKEIVDAFGGWAPDAPLMFDLEARKTMSNCLQSVLKKEETE
jgi:hypothetical protein